ncbi:MAG TPA: spondin domain-containing protein [Draconibacterium sp.]|nr:spondin domain-containing protein [Draconibacterium sp.]
MKVLRLIMSLVLVSIIFTQCKKDSFMNDLPDANLATKSANTNTPAGSYTVTVENVSTPYDYFAAGAEFGVTGGDNTPPANPGETITVHFHAGPNHKLSFASMYGASNDMFYAPDDDGISLFSGSTALEGDITNMISLWDAGTEVNGSGSPGTPESMPVEMVPSAENNIQVLLDYDDVSMFTLTIHVLPGSATPLSPVAWVVHSAGQYPIFKEGTLDYGDGLESLAEIGNPGPLSEYLKMHSGYVSPVAPFLWVLHDKKDMPIFTEGMAASSGLQMLAETGDPSGLYNELMTNYETGVQVGPNTPPIFPGEMLSFTIDGHVGQSISFASMLGASNDIFFSTGDKGIKLSNGVSEEDITHLFELYDAGTEVNEYPGAGIHQGGPVGNGTPENGVVHLENDGMSWPDVSQVIKVTIKKN